MEMSKGYIQSQLDSAQKLLWGGSETENIEAHNIIAKLLSDLGVDELPEEVIDSQQGKE